MRPQYLRSPPGVETGGLFYGCSGVLVIYGKGLARQIARQPCNDFFIAHHPNIGLQIKTNGFAKVSGVIKRSWYGGILLLELVELVVYLPVGQYICTGIQIIVGGSLKIGLHGFCGGLVHEGEEGNSAQHDSNRVLQPRSNVRKDGSAEKERKECCASIHSSKQCCRHAFQASRQANLKNQFGARHHHCPFGGGLDWPLGEEAGGMG